MKIVQQGSPPKPPAAVWPVGKTFECSFCKCRFEIETGDKFTQVTERSPFGKSVASLNCPQCHAPLSFVKPGGWTDG